MKIGVIGFGNMGSAIIDGMLAKGVVEAKEVYASASRYEKLVANCEKRGINPCRNALEVVKQSDVILIATPARIFREVLEEIADHVGERMVISVCSGSHYKDVKEWAPSLHFLAILPSTPIRYGAGIVIAEKESSLSEEDLRTFHALFDPIALVKTIGEEGIDVGSTIAGCGPAFGAMFLEALGDAGCKWGLSREDAYSLASQMLIGVGTSYLQSKKHPGILKDEVASPGGTTILGITKLEENGFRSAIIQAIDAISKRER